MPSVKKALFQQQNIKVMAEYRNNREVHFMVWETKPMTNKKNNIVKLVSENEISVGDVVEGDFYMWVVSELIDSRPSALKGKTYFTVRMGVTPKSFS